MQQWAQSQSALWLFLDYDGTLAEFAPDPGHAQPDSRVVDLLTRLAKARRPVRRVAVLSGRALASLRTLLPVEGIFLAGVYGLEILTPEGETIRQIDAKNLEAALSAMRSRWQAIIGARPGFFLEDKGLSLALHARWASEPDALDVLEQARKAVNSVPGGNHLGVLGGHRFLEVVPPMAGKGEAVNLLLRQFPLPDSRPLYFGDDDKDEAAFPVVHANGGMAVKIMQPAQASQPTTADLRLPSPAHALDWLESIA